MYKLLFKQLILGQVVKDDENFPNLFGKVEMFEFDTQSSPEFQLLKDFIEYSVRANEMMESDSKKWEELIDKEEWKYQELIDSEDWFLEDENGQRIKIMIPNFCINNGIVWRWD